MAPLSFFFETLIITKFVSNFVFGLLDLCRWPLLQHINNLTEKESLSEQKGFPLTKEWFVLRPGFEIKML